MNGNNKLDEYSLIEALDLFPYLKTLPKKVINDPKYIVKVKHNDDGTVSVEVGYPEDEFLLVA